MNKALALLENVKKTLTIEVDSKGNEKIICSHGKISRVLLGTKWQYSSEHLPTIVKVLNLLQEKNYVVGGCKINIVFDRNYFYELQDIFQVRRKRGAQ